MRSRRTRCTAVEMSVGDSLGLVGVTLLSGGFGASVGLEAAYTQLGAAHRVADRRMADLRRDDVRTLVGCGAAGGDRCRVQRTAHRRFLCLRADHRQLSLQTLAPVVVAALIGTMVMRELFGSQPDLRRLAFRVRLHRQFPDMFLRWSRLAGLVDRGR